jgi:hypothetical protein
MVETILAFYLITGYRIDYATKDGEIPDIKPQSWLFPREQDRDACELFKRVNGVTKDGGQTVEQKAYIYYVEPRVFRQQGLPPKNGFRSVEVTCKKWTVDIPGRGKEERTGVILP